MYSHIQIRRPLQTLSSGCLWGIFVGRWYVHPGSTPGTMVYLPHGLSQEVVDLDSSAKGRRAHRWHPFCSQWAGTPLGAEHNRDISLQGRQDSKRSARIMEYMRRPLFEAASAQGPERERKSSDAGSSSAVGATARSTATLFVVPMDTGDASLQQPLDLGEAQCFQIPAEQHATFNHQHKDTSTCKEADFCQSSPSFLTLLSTKKMLSPHKIN